MTDQGTPASVGGVPPQRSPSSSSSDCRSGGSDKCTKKKGAHIRPAVRNRRKVHQHAAASARSDTTSSSLAGTKAGAVGGVVPGGRSRPSASHAEVDSRTAEGDLDAMLEDARILLGRAAAATMSAAPSAPPSFAASVPSAGSDRDGGVPAAESSVARDSAPSEDEGKKNASRPAKVRAAAPAGILRRTPRYQSGKAAPPAGRAGGDAAAAVNGTASAPVLVQGEIAGGAPRADGGRGGNERKPCVKDLVVERRRPSSSTTKTAVRTSAAAAPGNPCAVEGYVPRMGASAAPRSGRGPSRRKGEPAVVVEDGGASESPRADGGGAPKVLRSIADLVEHARAVEEEASRGFDVTGARKRQAAEQQQEGVQKDDEMAVDEAARALEADLSFACMTRSEYDDTLALAASLGMVDEATGGIVRRPPSARPGAEGNGDAGGADGPNERRDDVSPDPNDRVREGDMFEAEEAAAAVIESPEFDGPSIDRGPTLEDVFFGRKDIFSSDDDTDADDDSIFDMTGYGSAEEEREGEIEPPEPRAFMRLWDAMAAWITPEAVALVRGWQQQAAGDDDGDGASASAPDMTPPPVDRTDVGASRCAGLMAMLRMHSNRCLVEAGLDSSDGHLRRTAEGRVGALVRTFDFTEPMAKLDLAMWRAMAAVMIGIVLPGSEGGDRGGEDLTVPASARTVGITSDEYRYLTLSAIPSLSFGSA